MPSEAASMISVCQPYQISTGGGGGREYFDAATLAAADDEADEDEDAGRGAVADDAEARSGSGVVVAPVELDVDDDGGRGGNVGGGADGLDGAVVGVSAERSRSCAFAVRGARRTEEAATSEATPTK
jgi:hypothetical protein